MDEVAVEREPIAERDGEAPASRNASDSWSHADRKISGGYFWFYAAIGALMPFIALYYRELGFSGIQVGVLTALPSLGMALFGPVLGAVTDSLAIHRWMLRGALVTGAVVAVAASRVSAFPSLLLLMGLLALTSVPVAPLLDTYGMTIGERTEQSYGSLRIWGSIGYMAAVLIVGWLMADDVSALVVVAHGVFLAAALLSTFALPPVAERRAVPLFSGLKTVLQNRSIVLLLLVAYLLSSGAAVMNIYLGVHLADIGGSATLVGVAFAVSAASELPVIAFGGWFLRRLGATRLIALAIVVYAVRFLGFALVDVPEWVLPIQALHGLSYGAFLMASVTLAHRLAGREYAATAQALLTAMSFGFGSITGSLVGGALLDRVGTTGLFQGAAVLMVVTLLVLIVGERLVGLVRNVSTPDVVKT